MPYVYSRPYVYSFWQIFQALQLFPAQRLFQTLEYQQSGNIQVLRRFRGVTTRNFTVFIVAWIFKIVYTLIVLRLLWGVASLLLLSLQKTRPTQKHGTSTKGSFMYYVNKGTGWVGSENGNFCWRSELHTLPFKMFGPSWSVWCKMALAEVGVSLPWWCHTLVLLAPGYWRIFFKSYNFS